MGAALLQEVRPCAGAPYHAVQVRGGDSGPRPPISPPAPPNSPPRYPPPPLSSVYLGALPGPLACRSRPSNGAAGAGIGEQQQAYADDTPRMLAARSMRTGYPNTPGGRQAAGAGVRAALALGVRVRGWVSQGRVRIPHRLWCAR